MTDRPKLAVVAVGGNALISDKDHLSIADQYQQASVTARHIADMIEAGWNVIVTHGNGPQMGFILRRSELSIHEVAPVPMDYAGADLQGAIGYMFVKAFRNEFRRRGLRRQPVAVVTETLVELADPAFREPTKPIGSHMEEALAKELAAKQGWIVREDAGRGWRRVVPSPAPKKIIDLDVIRTLADAGYVVIGCGGGGIPVVEDGDGALRGVEAVIDKDLASSLLARAIGADLFMVSTGVERVAVHFNKPKSTMARQDHGRRGGAVLCGGPVRQGQHGSEDPRAHRLPRGRRRGRADHEHREYRAGPRRRNRNPHRARVTPIRRWRPRT